MTRAIILNASPWQLNPREDELMYGYYLKIEKPPKPKSLLNYKGIPLINNHEKLLTRLGITDIRIMVNYKKEEIIEHIKSNNLNIKAVYNPEWEHPAASIQLGAKGCEEDIIVLFGDVWFTEEALEFLVNSDAPYSTIYSPNPEGVLRRYWHGGKIKNEHIDTFIDKYYSMHESDIKAYKMQDIFEALGETIKIDPDLKDFDIYERTEDFREEYKVGYAFMVADLFHVGHVNFLEKCKEHCDYLVVGVYTDELTESYKRKPIIPLAMRAKMIESSRMVDAVVVVEDLSCIPAVERMQDAGLKVDVVFHGDDWDIETNEHLKEIKEYIEARGGIIIQPRYTENVSTTRIIGAIVSRYLKQLEKEKENGD